MLLTLLLVSFIASAALGGVYSLTKDPIAAAKAAKKNMAIKRVTPDFNNQPGGEIISVEADGDSVYFYIARMDSAVVGYAAETFSNIAFGGSIKLMVGFEADGTIKDIAVLEHKETPGLGDKMAKAKSNWSYQFNGKHPESFTLAVKKDGGDVDAITASTISSRAYCDAVQTAYDALMDVKKKGGK